MDENKKKETPKGIYNSDFSNLKNKLKFLWQNKLLTLTLIMGFINFYYFLSPNRTNFSDRDDAFWNMIVFWFFAGVLCIETKKPEIKIESKARIPLVILLVLLSMGLLCYLVLYENLEFNIYLVLAFIVIVMIIFVISAMLGMFIYFYSTHPIVVLTSLKLIVLIKKFCNYLSNRPSKKYEISFNCSEKYSSGSTQNFLFMFLQMLILYSFILIISFKSQYILPSEKISIISNLILTDLILLPIATFFSILIFISLSGFRLNKKKIRTSVIGLLPVSFFSVITIVFWIIEIINRSDFEVLIGSAVYNAIVLVGLVWGFMFISKFSYDRTKNYFCKEIKKGRIILD